MTCDISVGALHGEASKPCLLLRPHADTLASDASRPFVIRLFPALPADLFPIRKLGPARNAVRPAHQPGQPPVDAPEADDAAAQQEWLATPRYNANVLEDTLYRSHLEQLHSALAPPSSSGGASSSASAASALAQAGVLLKLWLCQRGLHASQGRGGLGGFQVASLQLYLLGSRRLLPSMSSYQAFRVMLAFLATHDLAAQPLSLHQALAQSGAAQV